jgi:FkbM family methyltransferase
MKLEDTLNGGYRGLYGEVVTYDCYNLLQLDFVPGLVYDIGGNVGVFTRFARSLWPETKIIAVEPHPENIEVFKQFTDMKGITLIEAALGVGQLWHNLGAPNGAHESYVCSGLGFDDAKMGEAPNTEKSDIPTIMLNELIDHVWHKKEIKTVMKIDVEGAENCLWNDEPSMDVLRKMDYICMETHFYALSGGQMYDEMKEKTLAAFKILEDTHVCHFEHPHFQARKK